MARRRRRQFTDEFKRDAARLTRESDKGVAAIASDLDLSETVLRRWMREYGMDTKREPQGALNTDERGELLLLGALAHGDVSIDGASFSKRAGSPVVATRP